MSDKMKRLLSVLLTICMLAVMLPVPALTEADAPVLMQVVQSAPVPTDEATGTPTDAAEVKTIASFEAVAPEGFAVPQGTLETGLGLPASLSVQFADGAAGEVAVAWQCAAGYDPSAEAGTQFAFAAVLPEGYALAEGVSLPQILVTLTPPLANAMLMAQASGEGWTLSDDGTLTVTGDVNSNAISSWSDVTSIEVAEYANFTLDINVPFPGSITVMAYGGFNNHGNVSGDISVKSGGVFANYGTISGGTITGQVNNLTLGAITGGTFDGTVDNNQFISGGVFNGSVLNSARDPPALRFQPQRHGQRKHRHHRSDGDRQRRGDEGQLRRGYPRCPRRIVHRPVVPRARGRHARAGQGRRGVCKPARGDVYVASPPARAEDRDRL